MKLEVYVSHMMSKSNVRVFSLFLLVFILAVNACVPYGTSVPKTAFPPVVNTYTPPSPNLTATATQTAVQDNIQDAQYPDKILLNLGGIATNRCLSNSRAEIWISEYPFDTIFPLLRGPNTDYLYPSWSPDGEWVAYVESMPYELVDPINVQKTGTDSIWIMRGDGSDKKKISDDIPSVLIRSSFYNACFEETRVLFPLNWSQDGKYIAFVQSTWDKGPAYNYYAVDLASGNTQFLLSQHFSALPVWLADNTVAISDKGVIKLIKGLGTNNLTKTEISYPPSIPIESESYVSNLNNGKDLVVSFRIGSTLTSPVPKQVSVWAFNPISEEWKQLTTIDKKTWGIPDVGNKLVALCEEKVITLIDLNSWKTISQITSDNLNTDWIKCGLLRRVQQYARNDLFVLAVNSGSTLELEVIITGDQNSEIKTLIDSSAFSQIPEGVQILDFSLSPDY